MVKLTMIARVTDDLPLVEGLDDGRDLKDADFYKQQAKLLFKNLSKGQHEASRMSIETGPYLFHYIIEGRVCYLTMCDCSYPKKLAFQYLEDLKNEFERVNGNQIETAARPYAFIKFDTFIQKTKKLYLDTRTQRNLAKLNDELYEVHQIMTRNFQEVLGVEVSEMSNRLISDTRIYAEKAKDLNRQALIRKYALVAIVIGIVLMLFWVKNKIWLMDGQGTYHPKLHGMSCDSDVLAAIEYVRLCCWRKVILIARLSASVVRDFGMQCNNLR
uniref:Longin domain-containing protein n=1 Tax=Oryza rufipogon TaxID=4529 RepID=A0A0E0MTL6_ORYRU